MFGYSKVWEYYLEVCNDNDSFFGMTWPHLRSLLNNAEMTKTYILNPLAPEFIPKAVYPGAQGQSVYMPNPTGSHPAAAPHGPWPPAGYRGHPPQVKFKVNVSLSVCVGGCFARRDCLPIFRVPSISSMMVK